MAGRLSAHAKPAGPDAQLNRPFSMFLLLSMLAMALVDAMRPRMPAPVPKHIAVKRPFKGDIDAVAGLNLQAVLGGLIVAVLVVIVGFIGAGIMLKTAASQLPGYFSSGRAVINATSGANLDNGGPADSLLHGLSPVFALAIVIGPLGLILGIGAFFVIKKHKGGGIAT